LSATDPAKPPPAEPTRPIEWRLRGEFAAILDRLGLSLALSTRPNHIVFLGSADGQFNCSAAQVAQPIGLVASQTRLAIATARSIAVFANVARLAPHNPGRPGYYDAFYAPRTIHFTGDCHMHDMVFSGAAVIGANTNFSCICRVDGVHSFTPLWRPYFISQLRAEDRCHVNGFAGEGDQLRYVTALSATDVENGWRDAPDSGGVLIDAKANRILRSDLCMPHSPRLFDGRLYLLNGGEGEVLEIDRTDGRSRLLATLPAFTHGLAAHEGVIFVGMSQNRTSRKSNPPPVAARESALKAGVAALDMSTGAILGELEFVSGVTEVYDVQTLPGVRRAGMQSLLSPDRYVAVDTPNSVFWSMRPEGDPQHLHEVVGSGNYQLKIHSPPKDSQL
jgi:uncharacterized protein (TIGR03032 family)